LRRNRSEDRKDQKIDRDLERKNHDDLERQFIKERRDLKNYGKAF